MTETLEAPIQLTDGASHELADESSDDRTSPSKAKVRKKSTKSSKSSRANTTTTAEKASRRRAAAAVAARGNGKENGSEPAPQELEELPDDGSAAIAEHPVSDPLVAAVASPLLQSADSEEPESADSEELQPPDSEAESRQEITTRRGRAVTSWVGSNRLTSILAVALVVAVVFLALSQLSLNSQSSLNSARTSALTAARSYMVDLASYNYKHLNQDFGKVLSESTPTFKQNFTQSSEALKTAIVKYDASASAVVVGAGLVSATSSRAVVLVFLNQTVENTLQRSKPTSENRVEITLLRSGGRWLIDQVSLL